MLLYSEAVHLPVKTNTLLQKAADEESTVSLVPISLAKSHILQGQSLRNKPKAASEPAQGHVGALCLLPSRCDMHKPKDLQALAWY